MNHESISQLCITQRVEVQGTAQLLAALETLCREALQGHIDWPRERALATALRLDHLSAEALGQQLSVDGFVTGLGDRSVQFQVQARLGTRTVAQGTLGFTVVPDAWQPRAEAAAYAPALS